MHSSEPAAPPPAGGPALLMQLGKLMVRARSASPAPRAPRVPKPSTSRQVPSQPKPEPEEPTPGLEDQLSEHVNALWKEQIPICIEVLLAPACAECVSGLRAPDTEYERRPPPRALLLERWTLRALVHRSHEVPAFITSQWLLNAVRSQLHFSQLAAWLARLRPAGGPAERRRKLSREKCNIKKLESNCDENDPSIEERKLNIVYSIKIPGESYKMTEFPRPPTDHTFPVTDIGNNIFLKVNLESLPRLDDIPTVKCSCQKRRASKEIPSNVHEELVGKLNDLSLGPKYDNINSNIGSSSRRLSIISNPDTTEYLYSSVDKDTKKEDKIVDDRMHTPCSENGKHRCSCDDESDLNHRSSTSLYLPKKLDEKRLKEIAKYKRRLRKESKLKKLCDSTSSEGDAQRAKETHTSIPILQASRFDRFRAIGCYRNQTYLTLPASRIECKSPFVDSVSIPPQEIKKSVSVSTQTDDLTCQCGHAIGMSCGCCQRGMVRSEANYNLASVDKSEVLLDAIEKCQEENGGRRKCEDEAKSFKKLKCDFSSNLKCDNNIYNVADDRPSFSSNCNDFIELKGTGNDNGNAEGNELIRRPKLHRFLPVVDKIERIVTDRLTQDSNLPSDQQGDQQDTDQSNSNKQTKRQKTYSINDDDYVLFEKCDYGTIESCDIESPGDDQNAFKYPDGTEDPDKRSSPDNQVPSPSEMDRFRYRFDSAASMVFHTKTGLPLTSSPAPLRRGNNCFDFDDSINGISGIKSALFHPIAPAAPPPPAPAPRPAPPPAAPVAPPAPRTRDEIPKLRIGPSTGLLGSFEESALKGRLEPVATVAGFTAELGASGAFCPPHRRLPVTVFFYAPGGTNAPYMGHINLGAHGYRVARSGTIQVSLFNPHGTLVKMFVVLYDLTSMPPSARTFLRQRTLYMPAGAEPPLPQYVHKWLRYLIHLRFMTSKSGKLYLHTDIRIIVSRKADVDTATAHSALFRPVPTNHSAEAAPTANQGEGKDEPTNESEAHARGPNRFFGGCAEYDSENKMREIGYDNQNGVSYELRSFTYAPENPKYSPR